MGGVTYRQRVESVHAHAHYLFVSAVQPATSTMYRRMKVVVLALYLALVVGDQGTTSEPDIFCRAVSIAIGLNPVIQNCQTLKNEVSGSALLSQ